MSKLIVVSGLPGTGKSTIAEAIAKALHFPNFSVDPVESAIIKSGIKRSSKTGLAAYLVVESLLNEQLKLGQSVIVDAVSPVQEARDMWNKLSSKYGAKLLIIECVVDPNVHKQRIEKRVRNMHGLAEVTWKDVETRRKEYLPWKEYRLVLDTVESLDNTVIKALEYIQK